MSNTYTIQYYGTELAAKSFQIPIGEQLTFTVQIYNTDGTARDCSGGIVSFHFTRPNGPHITLPVDGEVSGVHTITLDSLTTILLDGTYTCDFWLTPATGSREKILLNSKLTLVSTVGPNGLYNPSTVIATNIETAKNEAIATAALDATTKANTARDYAIGIADGYANAAIATAALDATEKADAARDAAIGVADGYATNAIATAAADATEKANNAISIADGYATATYNSSIIYTDAAIAALIEARKSTTVDVSLPAATLTDVLPWAFSDLAPSASYICTLGTRTIIWQTSTPANSGSIDETVDLYMTTDGSSVATVTILSGQIPDLSRLPASLLGATCSITTSTGGITLNATAPAGIACTGRAHMWVSKFERIV